MCLPPFLCLLLRLSLSLPFPRLGRLDALRLLCCLTLLQHAELVLGQDACRRHRFRLRFSLLGRLRYQGIVHLWIEILINSSCNYMTSITIADKITTHSTEILQRFFSFFKWYRKTDPFTIRNGPSQFPNGPFHN